jgi:hypothetical protein
MKLKIPLLLFAAPVLALLNGGCATETKTASTTTTTKKRSDIYYTEDTPRTGSYIRRRYPVGAEPDVDTNLTNVRPSASAAMSSAGAGTGLSDRGSGR